MIISAHIGPKLLTDHAGIDSVFKRAHDFPQSPTWSLNKSLLFSDVFCYEINKEIQGFVFFLMRTMLQAFRMPSYRVHLRLLIEDDLFPRPLI